MPTKRLPRWAGPAAIIVILAIALFKSNETAPLPQGGGTAIGNDDQYAKAFNDVATLSTEQIKQYDAGATLSSAEMENLRKAGDLVDKMDAYKPLMATLYFASGKIHHILGEDEVAEERFRQCVIGMDRQIADQPQFASELKGTQAEAAYQLSQILIIRHDIQGAFDQATFAVKLNPQSSNYHMALGSALNEMRRVPEARSELTTALKLDPNNRRAATLLKFISK